MSNKVQRQNRDPFYYRFREQFVGLFVLIPLIAIPLMVINLFISSDIFNERFTLHMKLEHPARLEQGNSVTIMEKKVGFVQEVSLNHDGHLDIAMSIEEQYRPFIRNNSTGHVKQEQTIVGDWMIDITIGDNASDIIKENDTISAGQFIRVENMIQRLTNMSISASEILHQMVNGDGTISKLLSDDTLSQELLHLLNKSITLFSNLDGIVGDVDPLLHAGERAIHSLDSLGSRGVAMTDELVKFAQHASYLVDSMERVVNRIDTVAIETSAIPPVMEDSFQEFTKTLEKLDAVLLGLKHHWLLKRSIKKAEEKKERE